MKASTALLPFTLLGAALGVDMAKYQPGTGVEAAFKPFLESCAQGPAAIVKLKQALLPTTGEKHWNHLPNATTVYSETAGQKVYNVYGVIQTRFDGGNCSIAYYSSRFTVLKDGKGAVRNTPHSGSLVLYDDYVVSPGESPTHIPC
ncbi:hypothetical protein CTRI78_v005210 [Colletotrichum trifolii]|uniref:Uncharacterized protein n=1 Tax=Colletotrichum trifolii TaxID=5466 RepID=A0A4R8RF76_COLTR|nr:hypothetical protein CTRI78_v005210 [Colletotrichum trifolii]